MSPEPSSHKVPEEKICKSEDEGTSECTKTENYALRSSAHSSPMHETRTTPQQHSTEVFVHSGDKSLLNKKWKFTKFYDLYPYFLLYLIASTPAQQFYTSPKLELGGGTFKPLNTEDLSPQLNMNMNLMTSGREFFDPMVGSFKSNLKSDFFTSKLR